MTNSTYEKFIDGELFEKLVLCGACNLKAHIKTVNDLNVFPIPDGDTGDNMYMTISGGLGGLKAVKENSVCQKAQALAKGMLLNARGNSGVILSQLFSGMANGFKDSETATVKILGEAFVQGVKQAYSSVAQPVEGTILTVARESAEYALKKCDENTTVCEFFHNCVKEMKESLKRTPELLEALKEAGVIDSGGAGLLYITEGMESAAEGKDVEEIAFTEIETKNAKSVDFSNFNENSVMTFGYCTECLLQLQTSKTDVDSFEVSTIIKFLETIGDSIVAFKTGTVIKLHVHTMTPYKVLEFCQQFGEFLTIKIENMTLQHSETGEDFALNKSKTIKPKVKKEHKKHALVTVGTGEGLINTFYECGADLVIDGGQGHNPSIEDFIDAFNELDAEHIYVLPNNSNIIMAAKQASSMYDKAQIHIVPTKNFGHAYAILSMLDFSADDPDAIVEGMIEEMSCATTGMVTPSIRDANIDGVEIKKGEFIGFTDKTMHVSCGDKVSTFVQLADKLGAKEKAIMIVVYGKTVTDEQRLAVSASISEKYPELEFYELDGGQDVYEFIIILE